MTFKTFLENGQGNIISFDFDGVLHIEVHPGTIHPTIWDSSDLRPREEYIQKLKEEAKSHRVIIVSSRDKSNRAEVEGFVKANHLPVERVYLVYPHPKVPVLMQIGVIRHYDDDAINIRNQMKRYGATFEFVPVPMVGTND